MLKLLNVLIAATSVFHEGDKYYLQIILDECLYKF